MLIYGSPLRPQANPQAKNKKDVCVSDMCKTDELRALIEEAIKAAEALKVGGRLDERTS